eukprot:TRINITY_DN6975_c0_g1_i4.p1 TRINITY_DN6975_c0_g1~~TRINITY_DN6975_c0_g1_i4.p1  ORF type:complete len:473 (+),score=73.78 TRINITY_DN6975_c0_g1_i4:317-1735(+)
MLFGIYQNHETDAYCLAVSILGALVIPLPGVGVVLAAVRLLLFVRLEEHKAAMHPDAEEVEEKLARRYSQLQNPLIYAAAWVCTLIPALIFIFVGLRPDTVHVRPDGAETPAVPGQARVVPCIGVERSDNVVVAYFAFFISCVLVLYVQLKHARENLGIKKMFMMFAITLVVMMFISLILTLLRVYESVILLLVGTQSWPFITCVLPVIKHRLTQQRLRKSFKEATLQADAGGQSTQGKTSSALNMSFDEMLTDKPTLARFWTFLHKEFSSENLLFFLAAQNYRKAPTLERAVVLVHMYVLPTSALQVNLSGSVQKALLRFYSAHCGTKRSTGSGSRRGSPRVIPPNGTDLVQLSPISFARELTEKTPDSSLKTLEARSSPVEEPASAPAAALAPSPSRSPRSQPAGVTVGLSPAQRTNKYVIKTTGPARTPEELAVLFDSAIAEVTFILAHDVYPRFCTETRLNPTPPASV